jgi:hypothetical protein
VDQEQEPDGAQFTRVVIAASTVPAQSFGCILDWPKVRNTRMKNSDPEKLKEAMRIFRDSVSDKEYPVGTTLQLVPFEAMVKHPREKFPKTNGWEFFFLDVSQEGTKIKDRGESVVNLSQGITCLSCHKTAASFVGSQKGPIERTRVSIQPIAA